MAALVRCSPTWQAGDGQPGVRGRFLGPLAGCCLWQAARPCWDQGVAPVPGLSCPGEPRHQASVRWLLPALHYRVQHQHEPLLLCLLAACRRRQTAGMPLSRPIPAAQVSRVSMVQGVLPGHALL